MRQRPIGSQSVRFSRIQTRHLAVVFSISLRISKINTINEVSAACSVNGVYVSLLFKRYTKETPYKMLSRLKVTYAANLILRVNLSVKQVGAQVGFDDPYHFREFSNE